MSGDIFRDGPPTTTLGGAFKYPRCFCNEFLKTQTLTNLNFFSLSGDPPPSNEEVSAWVKKEMAKGWQSKG